MKTLLILSGLILGVGIKAAQAHGPSLPPDPWVGGGTGTPGSDIVILDDLGLD